MLSTPDQTFHTSPPAASIELVPFNVAQFVASVNAEKPDFLRAIQARAAIATSMLGIMPELSESDRLAVVVAKINDRVTRGAELLSKGSPDWSLLVYRAMQAEPRSIQPVVAEFKENSDVLSMCMHGAPNVLALRRDIFQQIGEVAAHLGLVVANTIGTQSQAEEVQILSDMWMLQLAKRLIVHPKADSSIRNVAETIDLALETRYFAPLKRSSDLNRIVLS